MPVPPVVRKVKASQITADSKDAPHGKHEAGAKDTNMLYLERIVSGCDPPNAGLRTLR